MGIVFSRSQQKWVKGEPDNDHPNGASLTHADAPAGLDLKVPESVRIYLMAGAQHVGGMPVLSNHTGPRRTSSLPGQHASLVRHPGARYAS